eukprot:TRINITY_DN24809_c0_g1_i1.p1 TRINITY_DN24809_c0_g1~~TRINITY_DN24809_c0_g1_i1.p1  ORF type:complete len:323 (+),score=59.18 TRINITY_DN24809_c0_g1_i1:164-1132(+)
MSMESGEEGIPRQQGLDPQKVNSAVALLRAHRDIIVCSYFAEEVFKKFLDELPEETGMTIVQLMKSVNVRLTDPHARKRFGDVLLGERERRFKSDEEYPENVHSTGLLAGDDTLLRAFFLEHPKFAEYITLIPNNPYYTSALGVASDKWKYKHPDPPGCPPAVPPSQRVLINDFDVSIRGSAVIALRRNLEKYPEHEWKTTFAAFERLVADVSDVLLPAEAITPRIIGRISYSTVDLEKKAVSLAHQFLTALSLTDPHLQPTPLFQYLCKTVKRTSMDLDKIIGDRSAWPGTKVKKFRDAVHRCMKTLHAHRKSLRQDKIGK